MTAPPSCTQTLSISWDDLHRDVCALATRLVAFGPWRGIVAVTRGGLVPAAILAREFDLRLVDTVCVASYDNRTQGQVTLLKAIAGDGDGLLVVDDLVDTGTTVLALRAVLPRAHFAVVYAKPAGRPLVDTFVAEINQDTWIEFPWDHQPKPA